MQRILFIIVIMCIGLTLKAQDIITLKTGAEISGKVLEVGDRNIKYKKSENPEGPTYVISISEVAAIGYENGTQDLFNTSQRKNEWKKAGRTTGIIDGESTDEIFAHLTRKGNKVYIESEDQAIITHASKALNFWGYWDITTYRRDADFILRFNTVNFGIGEKSGKAQFINPVNNEILKETRPVNTTISMDLNTKRGIINEIVEQEIIPMFPL